MSLIGEDGNKCVRMAHLATVGSHAVNGVAALHSDLLKASVLKDFYEMWPERFGNVTNGVTPRRFLALSNPGLRGLLDETIGDGWLTDLGKLRELEPLQQYVALQRGTTETVAPEETEAPEVPTPDTTPVETAAPPVVESPTQTRVADPETTTERR